MRVKAVILVELGFISEKGMLKLSNDNPLILPMYLLIKTAFLLSEWEQFKSFSWHYYYAILNVFRIVLR